MSGDKKKIEIKIEGNADSLQQATQKSGGFLSALKAQVALLVTQLQLAIPSFMGFGQAAVSVMSRAAVAAVGLTAHIVGLGVHLARLTANYLGLSVGIDTNNAKLELGRKAVEKFHVETRISLGFLRHFADLLKHLPFPVEPLTRFINLLAKMDIVLGIGRGKKINLFDDFGKGIDKAKGALEGLDKAVDAYANRIKGRLAKLAAVFTVEALVEWRGVKFEQAFSEVKKVADGSREQLRGLRKELLDMSTEISTPVEGLTQIAAVAGQMGIPTQQIKGFVELVSKTGVSFGLLPDQAASAMGRLRAIYGLSTQELEHLGDQINYVADNAQGTVSESGLLDVINNAGETAKGFGLLRSETIAMGAALLQTGKEPEKVSTAIRNLLVSLQAAPQGTKPFKEALAQMGLDANQLADDVANNPKKALDDFLLTIKKFDPQGQTGLLASMFGKGEDTEVIKTLISQFDEYQRLVKSAESGQAVGSMDRTFKEKEATAAAALQRLKNTIYALAVVSSDIFLPTINAVTNGLTGMVKWLKSISEEYPNLLAFLRIATLFGVIGSVIKLTFGAASLAAVKGFATAAVAYFQGGFVNGIKASIQALPAVFNVLFKSTIGKFLGGAVLIVGAFQVIPAVIGGVSTAVAFLASSPLALLGVGAAVVATKLLLPAAAAAKMGSMLGLLGRGMMMLVGGPIGLTISALAFLIVKYNEIKDVQFKFGDSTVTLSEILQAAWGLITRVFDGSSTAISNILNFLSEFLGNNLRKMAGDLNALFQPIKTWANSIIGVFNGLGNAIGVSMAIFVEKIQTQFDQAVALVKAAAKDIQAAWHFDFSTSHFSDQLAANVAENRAIEQRNGESPRMDAFLAGYNGDHVGDAAKWYGETFTTTWSTIGKAMVGTVNATQDEINAEIMRNRMKNATTKTATPSETRPSGSGAPLPDLPDDAGGSTDKAKARIKQLDDLQQQAIKNQLDRLKDQRDYELDALAVVYKERALNLKKLGLSEEEEKARQIALTQEQAAAEIAIKRDYLLKAAKLNDQAIAQKIKAAQAESAATATTGTGSLAALVAGGESGKQSYNAYNKGTTADKKIIPADKPIDLTALTIGEIQARQALSVINAERLGAVGKYQLIASTLKEAAAGLKLTADTQFDAATQEKLFIYLLAEKRPSVKDYITGKSGDVANVQTDAALEFASIADPKTNASHYEGNKATITTAQFQASLNAARANYQQNINAGMDKPTAFNKAVSGGGLSVDDQASLNNQLASLEQERIANRQDTANQLKKLGLDEKTASIEQSESVLELAKQANEREKALLSEHQQAQHNADSARIAAKQAALQQQADLGQIGQQEVLAQQKQLAAGQLAIDLKLAGQRLAITKKGTVERAQAEEQILQLRRDAAATGIGIDNQAMLERKRLIDSMFDPLLNAFEQMTNGVMTGQQTLSNGLRNMAQSITISYLQESLKQRAIKVRDWVFQKLGMADVLAEKKQLDILELAWGGAVWVAKKVRMGANWLFETLGFGVKETVKAGAVVAGEAAQTAAVVAGESARGGITLLGTLKAIGAKAAQAAAGAFSWVMTEVPWPFNMLLAPLAAAGAFVGTMAFGSMASSKGGLLEVPEDRLQFVHKKETILPAGVADNFRHVVDNAKQWMNPAELLNRFNAGLAPEAIKYMQNVKLKPLQPAPAAIMQFVAQRRAVEAQIQEKAQIKEQIQAEMRRITLELAAKNNRRPRDELRIHTIDAAELFKGRGGEAMVKELARQHRNFKRIKR